MPSPFSALWRTGKLLGTWPASDFPVIISSVDDDAKTGQAPLMVK
jgi:hypothetical protein